MARAIYKEVADLIKIGTFELVPLPDGRQAIGSKLVLKVKYRADGSWDKDKARLVALGFLERVGIDFYSTFAPMASLTSVRTIMSIAVHYGLPIFHADVPQAFLRSEMDTEVFLRLPKGVNIVDVNDASKSTYSLISAGRARPPSPRRPAETHPRSEETSRRSPPCYFRSSLVPGTFLTT